MEQVYVFSSDLVDEGHVCEVVLPAFSYYCRDVFVIFTAEQLTSRVVVEYVVHQHYLPWMEDIRLRRTGSGEAVMCTTQDSDPDQYRVFEALKQTFESKHIRVQPAVCVCAKVMSHCVHWCVSPSLCVLLRSRRPGAPLKPITNKTKTSPCPSESSSHCWPALKLKSTPSSTRSYSNKPRPPFCCSCACRGPTWR